MIMGFLGGGFPVPIRFPLSAACKDYGKVCGVVAFSVLDLCTLFMG